MLVTGALAGFVVFGISPTPAVEIRSLGVLFLVLIFALSLMSFSKPVVVRRDNGTFFARFRQGLRHFATMLALQTVLFALVIIPAYFVKSFSPAPANSQPAPADPTIASASSPNSSITGNSPMIPTSATSSSSAPPAISANSSAPTTSVNTAAPSAASAASSTKASVRTPAKTITEKLELPRPRSAADTGNGEIQP